MPFLPLPKDPQALRFEDGEVALHYILSTPSCPTFVHARSHAETFESAARKSRGSWHSKSLSTDSSQSGASNQGSSPSHSGKGACLQQADHLELDPAYPIVAFLPSECFSCVHLFSDQLSNTALASSFNLVAVDPRGHGLTKDLPIRSNAGRVYDLDVKAADLLAFIQQLSTRAMPDTEQGAVPTWEQGIHLVACSMSGLVATRMASQWPGVFTSIIIASPLEELESKFMIESFQGIKELLEDAWGQVHGAADPKSLHTAETVSMPGEVVQGFSYRWAGEEMIPKHIGSYLSKTWLERLVLRQDGMAAAKDWWFDLYWLRETMPSEARQAVTCDMLVIEGAHHLPYERQVGQDYRKLFPNTSRFTYQVIDDAPFLVSVTRPQALTQSLVNFLQGYGRDEALPRQSNRNLPRLGVDQVVRELTPDERFELIKVFAPGAVHSSEDEYETDDGSDDASYDLKDEEQVESSTFVGSLTDQKLTNNILTEGLMGIGISNKTEHYVAVLDER